MGLKRDIANALVTRLETIAALNYVQFGKVRMSSDDFRIDEFPAVQIYNTDETRQHIHRKIQVDWNCNLEIINRTTTDGAIEIRDLWDLEDTIEETLWERPKLDVGGGMIHLIHRGSYTVLPIDGDIYIQTIRFSARYLKNLVGNCT